MHFTHSLPRYSSGRPLDMSPIQKKPKFVSSQSKLSISAPNSNPNPNMLVSFQNTIQPRHQDSFMRVDFGSYLPHSSPYYPVSSQSHLPLSTDMTDLLKLIFNCSSPDKGITDEDDEVNLMTFIDNVGANACMPIIWGENQHHDIVCALKNICDDLTRGPGSFSNAWVTWPALVSHLESSVLCNPKSISVKNVIREKLKKAKEELQAMRLLNKRKHMQRDWASQTKLEYAQFLADILPELYSREGALSGASDMASGGGGAVVSRQQGSAGAPPGHDVGLCLPSAVSGKGGEEVTSAGGSKSVGAQHFRDIQQQLAKLELDTGLGPDAHVSDRVAEQMEQKKESDRAAELEIKRREKEFSLQDEGEGGDEAAGGVVAARVAMRLVPLSAEDEAKVSQALAPPHNSAILVDKFSQDISRLKMSCLKPGVWLNDEVVNFYMNMLQERDAALCALPGSSRKPSHFFNSFFVSKLLEGGNYAYKNVKRWTKKFDIFSKEKVFFPVNISNTHWTMMVAFIEKKKVMYYDSMGGSGSKYTKAIIRYLNDDSLDKRKHAIEVDEWSTGFTGQAGAPQQENGFDCGMFSTMYADFISDDLPFDFEQRDICDFRRKAVAAILRGSLSYPVS